MCVCVVAYERWSKDVVRAFFLMESRFVLELTETETDSSPQNRRMQYNSFLLSSAVVSAVAVVQWNEEDAWGKCTNAGMVAAIGLMRTVPTWCLKIGQQTDNSLDIYVPFQLLLLG